MDIDRLITDRARGIDVSGIRRIFDLGARLPDPINLSIGQPDFPVPEAVQRAAIGAIEGGRNGYSLTAGIAPLRSRISKWLRTDLGWETAEDVPDRPADVLVTSGTSGALVLAFLCLLGPGDEAIIPDPYFLMYPHLATLCGARAVKCDTYPDFRLTAERVEPLITDRTRLVLLNSPSNPCGTVNTPEECRDLLDLCRRRNVLLISDEIYDEFCYPEHATEPVARPVPGDPAPNRCPSPARLPDAAEDVLLIRGFGKTYGVTGWRLGYAAGPRRLIAEMAKLQQYTYVCAPAPLQAGAIACFDVDITPHVAEYRRRRDLVVDRLSSVTELPQPGGAFYAFANVPDRLGPATAFVERCLERSLLVIPGGVFSSRDTHVRLSYAASMQQLERGLDVLVDLMTS